MWRAARLGGVGNEARTPHTNHEDSTMNPTCKNTENMIRSLIRDAAAMNRCGAIKANIDTATENLYQRLPSGDYGRGDVRAVILDELAKCEAEDAGFSVDEAFGGGWMVCFRGLQTGDEVDASGAGNDTFESEYEAWAEAARLSALWREGAAQ